jgi:hypothetical protein
MQTDLTTDSESHHNQSHHFERFCFQGRLNSKKFEFQNFALQNFPVFSQQSESAYFTFKPSRIAQGKFLPPKLLHAKGIGGNCYGIKPDSAQWASILAH